MEEPLFFARIQNQRKIFKHIFIISSEAISAKDIFSVLFTLQMTISENTKEKEVWSIAFWAEEYRVEN